jgi:hypothetical protein
LKSIQTSSAISFLPGQVVSFPEGTKSPTIEIPLYQNRNPMSISLPENIQNEENALAAAFFQP